MSKLQELCERYQVALYNERELLKQILKAMLDLEDAEKSIRRKGAPDEPPEYPSRYYEILDRLESLKNQHERLLNLQGYLRIEILLEKHRERQRRTVESQVQDDLDATHHVLWPWNVPYV
jgi:hypothetical protein